MRLARLDKIKSNHDNLRTDSMQGIFETMPTVGSCFSIFGEGLKFGNRMIHTSLVTFVSMECEDEEGNTNIIFDTENSSYMLTLLGATNKTAEEYLKKHVKK